MANTLQRAKYLNLVGFPIPFHRSIAPACGFCMRYLGIQSQLLCSSTTMSMMLHLLSIWSSPRNRKKGVNQVIQSDLFLGFFCGSDLLERLSDLELRDSNGYIELLQSQPINGQNKICSAHSVKDVVCVFWRRKVLPEVTRMEVCTARCFNHVQSKNDWDTHHRLWPIRLELKKVRKSLLIRDMRAFRRI